MALPDQYSIGKFFLLGLVPPHRPVERAVASDLYAAA